MAQCNTATVDPAVCPLCGHANACLMCKVSSAAAQVQPPCWCVDAEFPTGLLDRLPDSAKSKACICANCVTEVKKEVKKAASGQSD